MGLWFKSRHSRFLPAGQVWHLAFPSLKGRLLFHRGATAKPLRLVMLASHFQVLLPQQTLHPDWQMWWLAQVLGALLQHHSHQGSFCSSSVLQFGDHCSELVHFSTEPSYVAFKLLKMDAGFARREISLCLLLSRH